LEAEKIIDFNKMKKNSATIDKIRKILNMHDTTIESKVVSDKLYLRNKNWDTIKEKLLPLDAVQSKKEKIAH